MRKLISGIVAVTMIALLSGCGGNERAMKEGERFRVVEELREAATTQWEGPYSDGFNYVIPPGTVLEVLYNTTPAAPYFECTIVVLDGKTDRAYIEQQVVPERILRREGLQGFSFSLPKSYIGTKIVEVE
jgi:hypothetical protein